MKLFPRILRIAFLPVVALTLASCSSTASVEEGGENAGGTDSPRRATWPAYTSPDVKRGRMEGIVFGDAEWQVPKSERAQVKAVATSMKVRAERVIIAGGADVTSLEYARQLGQQRALAVKEALQDEGIPANKMVTVSFGRDLPGKGGDRVEFGFVPTGEAPF
jgi:peptidoglycan-associated lipoprotein